MNNLIDIAGISTIAAIGTAATVLACAVNPIGGALLLTGAILWGKHNR